jgi:hypothetical protein
MRSKECASCEPSSGCAVTNCSEGHSNTDQLRVTSQLDRDNLYYRIPSTGSLNYLPLAVISITRAIYW